MGEDFVLSDVPEAKGFGSELKRSADTRLHQLVEKRVFSRRVRLHELSRAWRKAVDHVLVARLIARELLRRSCEERTDGVSVIELG
jgi:hypothetical protein